MTKITSISISNTTEQFITTFVATYFTSMRNILVTKEIEITPKYEIAVETFIIH